MIMMRGIAFRPGDWVIYRKTKHSDHPGPRAHRIAPAPNGDEYTYVVDKFWIVDEILDNGDLIIKTRRGKTHTVPASDSNLRRPNWWERLWYRDRFPETESSQCSSPHASESH